MNKLEQLQQAIADFRARCAELGLQSPNIGFHEDALPDWAASLPRDPDQLACYGNGRHGVFFTADIVPYSEHGSAVSIFVRRTATHAEIERLHRPNDAPCSAAPDQCKRGAA